MVTEVYEMPWLWTGLASFAVATFIAFWTVMPKESVKEAEGNKLLGTYFPYLERLVLAFLVLGVVLITVAIAQRWERVGHGPFVSMFELLMSQIWSLGLFFTIVYWRVPKVRSAAVVILPIIWVLGSWILLLEPHASFFPQTYYNDWKWAHIGLGKIFFAALLVATGFAGLILLRRIPNMAPLFKFAPADEVLDWLALRFLILALIFDSLMLIAGAVWAQDAWGRYWAWDDLETSSFLNWLGLGAAIHVRLNYRLPVWLNSLIIIGLFCFAFITYFGVPFFSTAIHKGVV